jgi:hypothetical protein
MPLGEENMRENWKEARKIIPVVVLTILCSLALGNIKIASSEGASVRIDLFTQKEPYSGRGVNMPSDAFGPQEDVILYALVTCNDVPVGNLLVDYVVKAPNGTYFSLSSSTNMSGIATVNFRIPTPSVNTSENDVFGNWSVLARALVAGNVYQDTLTFRVDWIVKLLSVETIDENLTYRSDFGRGGDVGLMITLRSIAMTLRNVTIEVVIKDEANVPVNSSNIQDFAVQPNGKTVFLYCKAALPAWAYVGNAEVLVAALESTNGTPYCPAISTDFMITTTNPLKIEYHDPGVIAVLPSVTSFQPYKSIQVGQGLSLETLVRNKGTLAQNFNVSTYFDGVLLGTSIVEGLLPYSTLGFNFTVNASLLTLGNHTISASIPPVPNQADLTDIYFIDVIEVTPKPSPTIDDIAITNIKVSSSSVFIGEMVQISVTINNTGTEVVAFNVSTFYNNSLIETLPVSMLEPSSQRTLTFAWNTTSVTEGYYQISAFAPLLGDPTPLDNTRVDGFVQVKTKPLYPLLSLPLLWLIVFMYIAALIAALLLLFLLWRRRRKKPKPYLYTAAIFPHP